MGEEVKKTVPRLCHDPIFKGIFLKEKEVLIKMIYDITSFYEFTSYEEVIAGYEVEPYKIGGKVNRSDMLVNMNNNYYLNIEINYNHEKTVMFRNSVQLFRICSQIIESGATDREISEKKVGQLNFNTFANDNGRVLKKGIYTDADTGKLINDMLTYWNLDIVKCYKKVYNNIENIQNLPKMVRWGAILYSKIYDTQNIDKILGCDLLDKEGKRKFMSRVKDMGNSKRIVQEWMVIENNRLREEGIINTAREEGIEQGIEQGIEKGIEQGANKRNIEVIQKMLNEQISYSIISKVTGKTVKEIKEIQSNLVNVY